MEKFSQWRVSSFPVVTDQQPANSPQDPGSGVAPFVLPIPVTTASLAPPLKLLAYAFAYSLASIRTCTVVLLLLLQFTLVEVLLKICLVVPPLYVLLARIVTAVLTRSALLVMGYWGIAPEDVTLKRTIRGPVAPAFSPGKGDLIIANSSSYVEILYLAFRYNPTFLLPVSSTGSKISSSTAAKITSFRTVSMLAAIQGSGLGPERSERGTSLEKCCKAARGPVVLFPEGTTSNNRALLLFAKLQEATQADSISPGSLRTFFISFRHDLPTAITPTATNPIPSLSSLKPLSHLFTLTTSPSPRSLIVRRLNPLESPKISSSPKATEWDLACEALAALGRFKRTQLDWEAKEKFLQFLRKRTGI